MFYSVKEVSTGKLYYWLQYKLYLASTEKFIGHESYIMNETLIEHFVFLLLFFKVGIELVSRDFDMDSPSPFRKTDIVGLVPVHKVMNKKSNNRTCPFLPCL